MIDMVVTWPKSKALEVYLHELEQATALGLEINFRVPTPPTRVEAIERCYIVHSGYVRGWNAVRSITKRGEREVARVVSDAFSGFWPAGWYIVRDPEWHPIDPLVPMRGFQGWRYFERP